MLRQGLRESWRWRGIFEVTLTDRRTGLDRVVVPNLIVDGGLGLTLDLWAGTETKGWGYIAIGTDGTAPAPGQTRLFEEVTRKAVALEKGSGELRATVFFDDTEANVHIREIGLFGGSTATSAPDTGILVARAVVDINKTNQHSLTITRRDLLSRG